jgi:hypothetical protein
MKLPTNRRKWLQDKWMKVSRRWELFSNTMYIPSSTKIYVVIMHWARFFAYKQAKTSNHDRYLSITTIYWPILLVESLMNLWKEVLYLIYWIVNFSKRITILECWYSHSSTSRTPKNRLINCKLSSTSWIRALVLKYTFFLELLTTMFS